MILFIIKKTAKHEYNANIRKAVCIARNNMLELLRRLDVGHLINKILEFISKFKSVRRPNRAFPRNFSSCKHAVGYRKNFLGGSFLS